MNGTEGWGLVTGSGPAAGCLRQVKEARRMGDAAKGRVDEEIFRRDLPIAVGRKPRRA